MIDVEITNNASQKATTYQVKTKLDKCVRFLKNDLRHPGLEYRKFNEIPGVWKFKIGDHYWGMVIKHPTKLNTLKVYDVVKHL